MDIKDIEQKAKEKAEEYAECIDLETKWKNPRVTIEEAYIAGAMAIFDLWKDCFRSCSSPWCRTYFSNFEVTGVLGNLTKKEVKV